jgi:hypothetical protein
MGGGCDLVDVGLLDRNAGAFVYPVLAKGIWAEQSMRVHDATSDTEES